MVLKQAQFSSFESFKNTEQMWGIIRNTYQHQQWLYLSSIIFTQYEQIEK